MLHPALSFVSLIHEVTFELAYQCTLNIVIIFCIGNISDRSS